MQENTDVAEKLVRPLGYMTFDGSIERISCITDHTDYTAMSNREVLKQVAQLLHDKSGRTYHRCANQSKNE